MQISQVEMRRLRYFVAVAEQRNFRAAALRLHISQPPLTRQIQQLEEALGVALFLRQPRGVELTEAGQVFLVEARNILSLTEQAVDRARLAGEGHLGRLDVGTFGSAVLNTVPKLLLEFRKNYPRVDVVLHNMNRAEQIKALREGRLTVGFNRFFQEEPDLTWERVKNERFRLAVYDGHPFARRDTISLDEITGQPLIIYPRAAPEGHGFNERLRAILSQRNVEPVIVQEVDDVTTAVSLVSGGFGICLLVESAAVLQLPGVLFKPLKEAGDYSFDLSMIYRKNDESQLLKAFRGVARRMRDSAN